MLEIIQTNIMFNLYRFFAIAQDNKNLATYFVVEYISGSR